MQLGRLEAPFEPKLRAAITAFDCGNQQVNGYLQGYAIRHQGRSCGSTLLHATVGLAHRVSDFVGVHVDWYRRRGWVLNDARRERDRLEGRNVTSMRFDLQRPAAE
jgi:hypothetical protein